MTTTTARDQDWLERTAAARAAMSQNDLEGAVRALKEAVRAAESIPNGDGNLASALTNLAQFHRRQQRPVEAVPLLERALSLRDGSLGPDEQLSLRTAALLAEAYQECGENVLALPLLARTAEALERRRHSMSEELTSNLTILARIYRRRNDYPRAESALRQLLAVLRPTPTDPAIANALADLAHTLQRLDRPAEAERLWLRAIELREPDENCTSAMLANATEGLAECCESLGRPGEALTLRVRALRQRGDGADGVEPESNGEAVGDSQPFNDSHPLNEHPAPLIDSDPSKFNVSDPLKSPDSARWRRAAMIAAAVVTIAIVALYASVGEAEMSTVPIASDPRPATPAPGVEQTVAAVPAPDTAAPLMLGAPSTAVYNPGTAAPNPAAPDSARQGAQAH